MRLPRALVIGYVLILVWGAWVTRGVDSDTGTPTSSAGVVTGNGTTPAAPTWAPPSQVAAGDVSRGPASPAARASRSHRPFPAVLLRIRECESGGDYRAENPTSSASGAWQITRGTWNHHRGYPTAGSAPRWVQDEKALLLYADRGTQPWVSSRACWS